jgi:hypothetical protein
MSKRMRSLLLALPLLLTACPRTGSDTAGTPRESGAASASPVNEKDITRYPYEKKLKDVPATLLKDGVVHKSPPDGPVITTLSKGTTVTQIAHTTDAFLVTYDDPSGAKMMGWIVESAFTNAPPVAAAGGGGGTSSSGGGARGGGASDAAPPPAPPAGTIFTQPTNGQCPAGFAKSNVGCHKTCGSDAECPSGTKCRSGVIGSTKICTTG